MPRVPVFVQTQSGKHPVPDLPESHCERGDSEPNGVSQDESRIALFVSDLLCRPLRRLPLQRLHSKQSRKIVSQPREAIHELQALVSTSKQVMLIDGELQQSLSALRAKARSFVGQVSDFVGTRILPKDEAFRVLKEILNFSPLKFENARLRRDTFLDYYLCESHIECHRGFLRVDDYYVKVLSLKDPSAQSFPLIFKRLLEVEANYFICSEWQKQDPAKSRSFIHSRRRHFHNTKRSLASYVTTSDQPQRSDDVLVDESKEAQIHDLGEALKELEIKGNYFGNYSLTIVVYDQDLARVESACSDFYKAFNVHDAQFY